MGGFLLLLLLLLLLLRSGEEWQSRLELTRTPATLKGYMTPGRRAEYRQPAAHALKPPGFGVGHSGLHPWYWLSLSRGLPRFFPKLIRPLMLRG